MAQTFYHRNVVFTSFSVNVTTKVKGKEIHSYSCDELHNEVWHFSFNVS